jgi:hypothetical protein
MTLPYRILRNPFQWSCAHFVDCVINKAHSECDEHSALKTLKITQAAQTSFRENKPVLL